MVALLVANDGGHLMQLFSMADRLDLPEDRVWLTTPTAQSKSLLSGQQVEWVGPAATRDLKAVGVNAWLARKVFSNVRITHAVSTGSSLALSTLPQAALRGISCYYIESATRFDGPSTSGRLLRRFPGVKCYTQYPNWAGRGWKYIGSVFDGYRVEAPSPVSDRNLRVVVSLGTSRTYGFRRLIERLVEILPSNSEVLWQTGVTDTSGLPLAARPSVPALELHQKMREADIVIAHCGTGVALSSLESGKFPILVPRRPEMNEHVDDHQLQIGRALREKGLAFVREVNDLTPDDFFRAAALRVSRPVGVGSTNW